jgi:hypothetical protein
MFDADLNPPSSEQSWDQLLWQPRSSMHQVCFTAHVGDWVNFRGSVDYINDHSGNAQRPMMLAVGYFPNGEGATIEQAAAGAYNDHYLHVAASIARKWPGALIRPAWELQGAWYPWGRPNRPDLDVPTYAAHYVAAFRHVVTQFRAVSNGFRYIFNPNAEPYGQPPWDCFPGPEWCDALGIDVYDQPDASHPDPDDRFRSVTSPAFDDLWQQAYRLGMAVAVPEWGCGKVDAQGGEGGGDNPLFIERISDWLKTVTLGVLIQAYWQSDEAYPANLNSRPLQKAAFISQWQRP